MTTSIEIRGLRLQAFHGVLPQERTVGNFYTIDLTIGADLAAAVETDDLGDTIDYGAVVRIIREEMDRPSALLEHVAGRILRHIAWTFPQATEADLSIAKLAPPVEGEVGSCAVRIVGPMESFRNLGE